MKCKLKYNFFVSVYILYLIDQQANNIKLREKEKILKIFYISLCKHDTTSKQELKEKKNIELQSTYDSKYKVKLFEKLRCTQTR